MSDTNETALDAHLFATLIAAREMRGEIALLGLSAEELDALCQRHFGRNGPVLRSIAVLPESHARFVGDLRALMRDLANASASPDDAACVATIVAHACLRPDHLWRDLGLTGRDDVTAMLTRYFPALVARNTGNVRWKKFLARELAHATGDAPGPAPGCPGCEDFTFCFPAK